MFEKFMLILARTLRDTWRAKVTFCPAWQFTKLKPRAVGAEYASWQHKKHLNSYVGTTNQDQATTDPASAVKVEQEGAPDDGLLNIPSHPMNVFFSWGRITSQAVTAVFPMLLDNNGGLRFGNDYR